MLKESAGVDSKKPTLLILKHFHKLKAAEHEVVERLFASSIEIGWTPRVVEVDSDFEYQKIVQIEQDVDLVLDIHYEYPKFFKARSIGAFWTPTSLMKDWDLAYVMENQLSHDYLVHSGSNKILELIDSFRPNEQFGILNHSLPGSWVDWINTTKRNNEPRAFYAGINWNKLSGRPGRHHNFFKLLDNDEVLDIYGPRKISHVIPWKGFNSYRGEIPFDGKSIISKARESGISLILSAEQHLQEGIISSRFFEGIAAGNAIISEGHPFIKREFGKNGLYLNLDRGDEYAAKQLIEYVHQLREDPKILKSKQEFSQSLFLDKFDMTKQLRKILNQGIHAQLAPQIPLDALILGSPSNRLREKLENLGFKRIEYTNIKLVDLQDLLSLAGSLELKEFCVFESSTEILDGFASSLENLIKRMKTRNSQFGVMPTTVLSQGSRKFTPVLIGSVELRAVPLNGLVVHRNLRKPVVEALPQKVPHLRLRSLKDVRYVSTFHDSLGLLTGINENLQKHPMLTVREAIRLQLMSVGYRSHLDVVEEIRMLPRARKKLLAYVLIAATPIARPLVLVMKHILRIKS